MPSVAKHDPTAGDTDAPVREAKCLAGRVDGDVVFRVTKCRRERMQVRRRPARHWLRAGWFANDLLDE